MDSSTKVRKAKVNASVKRVSCKKQRQHDNIRLLTLESYTNCIFEHFQTNFVGKFHFNYNSQLKHFEKIFSDFEFKVWPKVFKGMLADYFSIRNKQDRPDVPLSGDHLFYPKYGKSVYFALTSSQKNRVRITWDLMQSKSLAAKVTKDFIKDAYEKHASTVSQSKTTHENLLTSFKSFCDKYWSPYVKEELDKQLTKLATSKASYEKPHSQGGIRKTVRAKHLSNNLLQPSEPRLDPVCISLIGGAGEGKSLIQTKVAKKFSKILKKSYRETSYCRNAMTKHWDGYQSQPIVMIDDYLQQVQKKATPDESVTEFITLNSSVDYILPMADLKDKGLRFTSPILIYSSNKNLKQQVSAMEFNLTDRKAIMRRFRYVVNVQKDNYKIAEIVDYPTKDVIFNQDMSLTKTIYQTKDINQLVDKLCNLLLREWSRKSLFYQDNIQTDTYTQPITRDGSLVYQWDTEDLGHNRVKVHGIEEPLKVRTITIGTDKNWILKPLQLGMLYALKRYKCFKPCFTPDYAEDLKALYNKGNLWVSGDYTSATDGLHSDIMQTAIESLSEALGDHPIVPFMLREAGPHLCEYPSWSGVPDTWQTNGQLMGSLLSFPILCLANAFTVCYTQQKKLEDINALFHGDDLLMRCEISDYHAWKSMTKDIGLELSIGKNYISPVWGSIDSQVFYGPNCYHLTTGKYKCYDNASEGAITELLKKGLSKALVASKIKKSGLQTARSIDVHTDYGGLNPNGREPETDWEKNIFFLKSRKSLPYRETILGGYVYHIPTEETLESHLSTSIVEEESDPEPSLYTETNSVLRQCSEWRKQKIVKSIALLPESQLIAVFAESVVPRYENIIRWFKKGFVLTKKENQTGTYQRFDW